MRRQEFRQEECGPSGDGVNGKKGIQVGGSLITEGEQYVLLGTRMAAYITLRSRSHSCFGETERGQIGPQMWLASSSLRASP